MSWLGALLRRRFFWAGLVVRIACAPFVLQWFHPDERQMFELAHFQVNGRLHPFMEAAFHMRNLTASWIFSWIIRALDFMRLGSAQAHLIGIHIFVGLWSWIGLCALTEVCRDETDDRTADRLGWFFALFWGFSFLYSRQLLEAVSAPAAFLLLLAVRRKKFFTGGFFGGLGAVLRYPSALWGTGGFAVLCLWARKEPGRARAFWVAGVLFGLGVLTAVLLGGVQDYRYYGKFLESAPAYFAFNRPHGPVERMFGSDSLYVYLRWFEFLFTPWLAPAVIVVGGVALLLSPELLIFCLPYLVGHVWTPHREPRFMLPLTPLIAVAIAVQLYRRREWLERGWVRIPRVVRGGLVGFAGVHVLINFCWFPVVGWAQWNSAQGVLLRNATELGSEPTRLLNYGDPIIDAFLPPSVRWSDGGCGWHRPPLENEPETRVRVIAGSSPMEGCRAISGAGPSTNEPVQRFLRVRFAKLWDCPVTVVGILCPRGMQRELPGEPAVGGRL